MLSQGQRTLHKNNFNEENRLKKLNKLREKSKLRISKINEKVNIAKENIQDIEPIYLDIFIQAYHEKELQLKKNGNCERVTKYDSKKY